MESGHRVGDRVDRADGPADGPDSTDAEAEGPPSAGMRAAEAMISEYAPGCLLATGLAGALRREWAPPKTMIAACVIDEETGREFKTMNGQGTVVSSRTIAGAGKKHELAGRFAADIVDMEGAAVGEVAASHGIPFLAVKAVSDELDFELPPLPPGSSWRLLLDTSLAPPDDIHDRPDALQIDSPTYRAAPRSVVVFVADL